MAVRCQLDETMTPEDLDDMYEAVEFMIPEVAGQLSNDVGPLSAKYLLAGIRKRCRAIWSSYLMDIVV
jgi:nanoRNase/pAp phosphatase (c-di-AMP/oligoRNAs hydrolase)